MTTLRVGLGASTVGALEYFEDTEEYRFSFDECWLRDPDRPVLGQIFEERRPKTIEYVGPPCWFSHLLPQGALRRAITRALGVTEDAATSAEFALYEFLGADLPGAVLLEPVKDAASRRSRRHALASVGERFPWRSSLAGMQLKMSVRKRERGIVLPVVGAAGNTIAKFHSPDFKLIVAVLAAHCPEDVRALVERLTFRVLAGNGDAHLKNWALWYPDGRRPRLSPAYDIVSTILYPAHLADPLARAVHRRRVALRRDSRGVVRTDRTRMRAIVRRGCGVGPRGGRAHAYRVGRGAS